MSTPPSAVGERQTRPDIGQVVLTGASASGRDRSSDEASQRALLNILEDFAAEKNNLEHGQRAMLNILEDVDVEKAGMEGAQRAVLNILEDVAEEKTRLAETQHAVLNILDDFETEKSRVEMTNRQLQKEMEERKRVEAQVQDMNTELLAANKELEAFSYSVSHDLRAPLRSIDGFSLALLDDYADKLDEDGRDYLRRVRAATQKMGTLIDDMLNLARVTRTEMRPENADLSAIARSIAAELQNTEPGRRTEFRIEEGLAAVVDSHLLRIALVNLMGNAWKFSSKRESACIEFGRMDCERGAAYYVRDNGAGFDPAYAERLFGAFQRLHDYAEFPGTGVGLATVQRIIHRHGGSIWAESAVERGATFYFTLPETRPRGA
jgi:light-regulated signal transduction histidine kinase (bacteriophytochrome)